MQGLATYNSAVDTATDNSRSWQLLPLSGKSEEALAEMTQQLSVELNEGSIDHLAAMAYRLQSEPEFSSQRKIILASTTQDALIALQTENSRQLFTASQKYDKPSVTFLFPGLGDQHLNMAGQLYRDESLFRNVIDECAMLLAPQIDVDLRNILYKSHPTEPKNGSQHELANESKNSEGIDLRQMVGRSGKKPNVGRLKETSLAQPALFMIEYALAQLWSSWGIEPDAMIGYSLGEYVAACQAGVFSLEDALRIVAYRAQLINALPAGAMLAIALPEEKAKKYLRSNVSLSAINGPMMCVAAGASNDVARLEKRLTRERIACRPLQTIHAFHSHMMEPAAKTLAEFIGSMALRPPSIPYISNVTGTWITPEQATDPDYWVSHMLQPVRFADGLQTLWAKPDNILLEVGIGQTLGGLAMQHPARRSVSDPLVLSSLPTSYSGEPDILYLLRSLAQLWLAGAEVNWSAFQKQELA
ncbi:MAG: acyltransferase domain-containing protein [Chloroflexota bacterium]